MKESSFRLLVCVLALLSSSVLGQDEGLEVVPPREDRQVSFANDVLPVLQKNCLACHNKSETEGELIMESVASLMEGGDSGPAIVEGDADESLMFQLASHRTEPIMPPVDNDVGAKPMSAKALGLLKAWIDQGAKPDEETKTKSIQWKKIPLSYAQIFALELSPDGRWLVAGRGNEIVVYSVAGKREVQRLVDPAIADSHGRAAHLDVVQSLAWSPDQSTIVSGGFRCVKVWHRNSPVVDNWQPTSEDQKLLGDDLGNVQGFTLNEDKTRLIALVNADSGVSAKVVELPSRKVLREISAEVFSDQQRKQAERKVGLSKERLRVANADVETAKKRKEDDEKNSKKNEDDLKKAREEVPKKLEVSKKAEEAKNKKMAEVAAQEKVLQQRKAELTDAASEEKEAKQAEGKQAEGKQAEARQAAVKQAEEQLAQRKKELAAAEKEAKKKLQEFEGAEKVVTLAEEAIKRAKKAVALRTQELSSAEEEATKFAALVKEAEAASAKVNAELDAEATKLSSVHRIDDGQFAIRADDGRLACFDFMTGELMCVGKSPSAESQANGDWTLVEMIGDPATDSVFADRVTSLAFNSDGSVLASGGGEPSRTGEVQLWNTSDWSMMGQLKDIHSDVVYDLQFSPQDEMLASCGSDRMMKTIDSKTAKVVRNFEGHTGHVLGVTWKADGRTLATAGADKVVKVWDAKEGTQKKTVSGFKSEVTAVRFMGLDDRFVFSTGAGKVESRDSNGGGKPSFGGFSDYVHKVTSSLDGQVIAASGQDQVIRVWDATGKLIAEFK